MTARGVTLSSGDGTRRLEQPQDFAKARHWAELAADQGSAEALYLLHEIYEFGRGVPVDGRRAESYLERSIHEAERGDPYTQALIRKGLKERGDFATPVNPVEAVRLFEQAANLGLLASRGVAHLQLGHCYKFGSGVPRDHARAMAEYVRACIPSGIGGLAEEVQVLKSHQAVHELETFCDEARRAITKPTDDIWKTPVLAELREFYPDEAALLPRLVSGLPEPR